MRRRYSSKMKEEGKGSKAPLTESFFHYPNNKYVLLALLGATAGQGVVWYTGQFYALFFLTITLKLIYVPAYLMIGLSLVIGTPFFIFFGWLSDKIGRLKIILAGCLIAAVTYFPLFAGADPLRQSGPRGVRSRRTRSRSPPTRRPATSTSSWDPGHNFTHCDRAQDFLTKSGLSFKIVQRARSEVSRHDRSDRPRSSGWDNGEVERRAQGRRATRRRPTQPRSTGS